MSNYSELLKDPRWQKKRLDIFNRDEWTCQECHATHKTLHCHHIKYVGEFPWETPDLFLNTLCCDCHKDEEEIKKQDLLEILDDCGLTRESVKRVLTYIAFKVKKHTPENSSPFWALHNEVLTLLIHSSEFDELLDYIKKGIVPKLPQEAEHG